MEIEKVVQAKFDEIVQSGFIEERIKQTLEKTLSDLIENAMRSYSDFGKGVDAKIKESLDIGNMKLSLPEYNQLICNWIQEIVNNSIMTAGKEQIQKNITDFLQPLEKSEWKITEIIEKFIESECREDREEESGEITFIPELNSYDHTYYYFDKEPNKRKYDCDYMITTYKGEVCRTNIDGSEAGKMKSKHLYKFDSFMFQLFATRSTIINDSDSVEIEWSNYND